MGVHEPDGVFMPRKADLLNAFPNPFNGSTAIRYALPQAETVRLTIIDMLGREVAVLASRRMDAGTHNVTWDAGNRASGMYVCRLAAGTLVESKKIMIVR